MTLKSHKFSINHISRPRQTISTPKSLLSRVPDANVTFYHLYFSAVGETAASTRKNLSWADDMQYTYTFAKCTNIFADPILNLPSEFERPEVYSFCTLCIALYHVHSLLFSHLLPGHEVRPRRYEESLSYEIF